MNWTTKSFLDWSVERLNEAGVDSPRLDAEVLFAGALHTGREEIYLHPDRFLEEAELTLFRNYVERRALREPVCYILGRREFWGLDFKVNREVLAPRPETEILIERLLEAAALLKRNSPARILDMGCGSGNIARAAAKEFPDSLITATDISAGALGIARQNARTHSVSDRIRFVQCDLFEGLNEGNFDFILSNPPYIDPDQWRVLMPEVRDYEPRLALDGGPGGLDFFKRIIHGARDNLSDRGLLMMEIGESQAGPVTRLFQDFGGYVTPVVSQDYSGRDRVIYARKGLNG